MRSPALNWIFSDTDACVAEGGQHIVRVFEFDRSMAGIQAHAEMLSQCIFGLAGLETGQSGEVCDSRSAEQMGLKEGHGFRHRFEQAAGFRLQSACDDATRCFLKSMQRSRVSQELTGDTGSGLA